MQSTHYNLSGVALAFGVYPSTVTRAYQTEQIKPTLMFTSGNGDQRPLFSHKVAHAWATKHAAQVNERHARSASRARKVSNAIGGKRKKVSK